MKKIISVMLALTFMLSALALTSCGEEKKPAKPEATAQETTAPETTPAKISTLAEYYNKTITGDNPVFGVWERDKGSLVKVIFRNDSLAETVIGGEGGLGKLTIDEKQKTLATQLVIGIDGTYKYSLSKDNNTLTLKNEDETIKLMRAEYTMVPDAPKKVKTDSKLIGWWKNADGFVYSFGGDGLMYTNMISTETYYTYTADNGVVNAVYDYDGDMEVSFKYEFKGKKLLIDGSECEKYEP